MGRVESVKPTFVGTTAKVGCRLRKGIGDLYEISFIDWGGKIW